ncbi:MAG TPA: glucose-1-phosphate thymidylyltransferase [Candidatus Methylomirabilis sp.]|nr:glucose-1-phosphate thymidylyltransferase [Candidatus Methylomirabilis sp.]
MKALIAAGGRATRLRPITHTINKHLIPLANKPMIEFAIEKMADAGIREVAINTNPGDTELSNALGDGSRFGVRLTFIEQQGGPRGVGHIIQNASAWVGDEPFVFYLGDNIILGSIRPLVERFVNEDLDCLLALSRVENPQRFGVPEFSDGRIVRVIEKPADPPSPYAVTGIYLYKPCVFNAASQVQPSPRGEIEISDVHTKLIEQGRRVGYEEITGWWKDTGKPEDLLEGNALLLAEACRTGRCSLGTVEEGAVIQGSVIVGEGSVINSGSVIRGPVSIGRNCRIVNAVVGPHVSVGNDVTIEHTILTNSLVMDEAMIAGGGRISDSIFGRKTRVVHGGSGASRGHAFIIGDNAVVEL